MKNKGLSVCIIVKNEEKNLSRCLGSIEDIADEIIVVDTGSIDNTKKIAKGFGAIIYEKSWNNNFSEVRNFALEKCTNEWILYLDADEALDEQDAFSLKNILLKEYEGNLQGFCLTLINVVDSKKTLSIKSLRVIRNRDKYRFQGKIHEQIFPSIEKFYGKESIKILDIKFYHYGYDENEFNIKNKIERNFRIFRSYKENEKDAFYYYNLGNEYMRINDLRNSLKNYIKSNESEGYDNGFRVFLPIYITKAYYDLKYYKQGIEEGEKFIKKYPNYKDLYFLVGACYYSINNYKEARKAFINYIIYSNYDYGYPEFHLNQVNNINKLLLELDDKINHKKII